MDADDSGGCILSAVGVWARRSANFGAWSLSRCAMHLPGLSPLGARVVGWLRPFGAGARDPLLSTSGFFGP